MDRDGYTKFEERTPADEALEAARALGAPKEGARHPQRESVPFIDLVRLATREGRLVIRAPAYYFREAEAAGYVPAWVNEVGVVISYRTMDSGAFLCLRNSRIERTTYVLYIPRNSTNEDLHKDRYEYTSSLCLDPYAFSNADTHWWCKPLFHVPLCAFHVCSYSLFCLPRPVLDVLACGRNKDPASYVRAA